MINNFKNVESLFNITPGNYISGVILKRNKDKIIHPELDQDSIKEDFKFYCFESYEEFLSHEEEIKVICNALNLRFYLYPRPLSFKKVAFSLLKTTIDNLDLRGERVAIKNIDKILRYERPYSIDNTKSYLLIDFDNKENIEFVRKEILNIIKDKLIIDIPTLYGQHFLIENPSWEETEELKTLSKEIDDFTIKVDSPILIYYNED